METPSTKLCSRRRDKHVMAFSRTKIARPEMHPGSILSVDSNQNVESKTKNVESKTEKYGVQDSIWSVDSENNH